MKPLDLVVGAAAVGLGVLFLIAGIVGSDELLRLSRLQRLIAQTGRTTARIISAILGLTLISLGIAIAIGWRLNWE